MYLPGPWAQPAEPSPRNILEMLRVKLAELTEVVGINRDHPNEEEQRLFPECAIAGGPPSSLVFARS